MKEKTERGKGKEMSKQIKILMRDVGRYVVVDHTPSTKQTEGILVDLDSPTDVPKRKDRYAQVFDIRENFLFTVSMNQIIGMGSHVTSDAFEGVVHFDKV